MLASLAPGVGVLSGVIESYQLRNLTQDVAALQASVTTVLNVAAAGAVVSGLGLVTSIAGFAYLARRFDQIDKTINDIAKGVRDIKDWGRGLEKARLHNAISSLRQVSSLDKSNLQHELLLQCKQDFGLLARFYAGRWVDAQEISEVEAIGELYTLSLLGDAMACSGLGLFEEAAVNLAETSAAWTAQARDHAKTILFAGRPGPSHGWRICRNCCQPRYWSTCWTLRMTVPEEWSGSMISERRRVSRTDWRGWPTR